MAGLTMAGGSVPIALAAALAALVLLPAGCGGGQKPPDILLVVLDTVRADAAGPDVGDALWRGQTPNLDRLAAEGTVFDNAWALAPWTVPSHASLFTGLTPAEHHCTSVDTRLRAEGPTLAEMLAGAGYATAAFYSNPWLSDRASGLLRGFAVRVEAPIGGLNQLTAAEGDQGGRHTLASLAGWLSAERGDRPFFLFVNLLEAHLPYNPPAEIRREHLSDLPGTAHVPIQLGHDVNAGRVPAEKIEWRTVRRLYGGDVRTVDRMLGELIELLRERGLYDRTLLVVTSDHGENLGDHGLMDHQFSLHETLLRVPLVIRDPSGRIARGRRSDPVLLTDLFATLPAAAGVAGAPARPRARDLAGPPGDEGRPLPADYAGPSAGLLGLLRKLNPEVETARLARGLRTVRVGSLRLTVGSDGTQWLHDLSADPDQRVDLSAERPQAVEELARLLVRGAAPSGEPAAPLDSATLRQLESLGYIR